MVVYSRRSLHSLPHYTKTHNIESPVDKLIYILIGKRRLRVVSVVRDVWGHLVYHVDAMENDVTAILLTDGSVLWVDPNVPSGS